MENNITVSWFSSGVSSAVATKLCVHEIDRIIYIHIEDQHPDTLRFIKDCEKWFGKEIEIIQSPYKNVNNVVMTFGFVNSPWGAKCTEILKKRLRHDFENEHIRDELTYVWGFDSNENSRANSIFENMPHQKHKFPLIERGIGKKAAHEILNASNIKRPAMYEMGYNNNNCIGCVKGGMGYWNKIRKDFPNVFSNRAQMEREIGHSCINGIFLDELNPNAGRMDKIILDDCGILCELIAM
jgi:hypothetical protein